MTHTKKLLSITNLKKYFPVAKTSIFQKNQLYVRANEDITIDIYEGETIGVVGESGCGKSTLGRVLLQLYPQTAGNTMYYGATLAQVAPRYVEDTLRHTGKYRQKLKKASEKAAEFTKKVDAVGEDKADFYLLQNRNLARCEEQTCLNNIVKILGGFFAVDENERGRELLLKIYEQNVARNKLVVKRTDAAVLHDHLTQPDGKSAPANTKARTEKLESTIKALDAEIEKYDETIGGLQAELSAIKAKYADDPAFQQYEAMRDEGIDLARLQYREMRLLRKDLQIIFQDPYSSLNPRFTIGQIIEEGLVTHKFYKHGSAKSEVHRLRRVRFRARRIDPVADHQSAAGAQGTRKPDVHVHFARSVGGALYLRPHLRHVPRQHRGTGRRRNDLR